MFLVRLIHISGIKKKEDNNEKKNLTNTITTSADLDFKKDDAIDQIKNITQRKKQNQKFSQI